MNDKSFDEIIKSFLTEFGASRSYQFHLEGLTDCSMIHSALIGFEEYQTNYRWIPSEAHLISARKLQRRLDYPNRDDFREIVMNLLEASVLIEALNRFSTRVSYTHEQERIADLITRLRQMITG